MECVVPPRDPGAFARRSVRALKDAPLRNGWGRIGEKHAALFSEDRVLEAYLRMIDGQALDWDAFLSSREAGL
jgi:hypothetical protein